MKKTLIMISNPKAILIQEDSQTIITIDKTKMEVTGEKIYEALFKDIPLNEKIEITVTGKENLIGNDSIVFDRFNELIQTIVREIGKITSPKDEKGSA